MTALLDVKGLTVRYDGGHLANDGVDLTVAAGELVSVVGESGSGKTTLVRAALGLLPRSARTTAGSIHLGGRDVTTWNDRQFSTLRGPFVGFVPQDPGNSLNPVKRVGRQVVEAVLLHDRKLRPEAARARGLEKLRTAGLDDAERVFAAYPHELSGGMKQRALIAIALASDPELLIADEPTSALDVTVQKTILDHLDHLRREFDLGVLLITHDLGVAVERSDRLVVLRGGVVVESGRSAEVAAHPEEDYTRRLLAAAPSAHSRRLTGPPRDGVPQQQVGRPLLVADRIGKQYSSGHGRHRTTFDAVTDVSFEIGAGTTHALVGESGAGKSTLARIVAAFTAATDGTVRIGDGTTEFAGDLPRDRRKQFRRHVQFVHQNPFSSLDPTYTVRRLVAEPLRIHRLATGDAVDTRVRELLAAVALAPEHLERKASELSGGQAQRVAIARALAVEPRLLVLDEAVSALDVSVQAQVLQLLADLQSRLGLTYLFITHDLGVVRLIADTVTVLQHGRVVEQGLVEEIFAAPQQEYTRSLLLAVPGTTQEAS